MKRIIFDVENKETINLSDVDEDDPIFAKKDGELRGMIVKEDDHWILRLGGSAGATGTHNTLRECIKSCLFYDYKFFV